MKKLLKFTALFLSVALLLLPTVSCSAQKTAVRYKNTVISENIYQFYMSRYKAQILSSYNSGQDNMSFWNKEIEDGKTYADFFEELIRDNIKINAICVQLFEDYGLKLSEDVYSSIDEEISDLIAEYGSRSEFNLEAAQYGVNDKMLREVYIMDSKIKALYSYMFGEGGVDAVTDGDRESYYRENYVRMKTIFVNTTYVFVTDEEGNILYDDEGYAKTLDMTDEQKATAEAKADELRAKLEAGGDFESLIAEYSDDPSSTAYSEGFYFNADSNYYGNVIDVAFELKNGQWGEAESEYGRHFVLRLPLADEAYKSSDEKLTEFFEDLDDEIANKKFDDKIKELVNEVEVNDSICDSFSLTVVPQNLDM